MHPTSNRRAKPAGDYFNASMPIVLKTFANATWQQIKINLEIERRSEIPPTPPSPPPPNMIIYGSYIGQYFSFFIVTHVLHNLYERNVNLIRLEFDRMNYETEM